MMPIFNIRIILLGIRKKDEKAEFNMKMKKRKQKQQTSKETHKTQQIALRPFVFESPAELTEIR